jgi:hypothetical protein
VTDTDTTPEPLLHIEEMTPIHGFPTGHARCGADDGLIANNSGLATCEACIDWEPDDAPEPSDGEHGTCAACGGEIGFQDAPGGGWWIHDTHPADGHDAQSGGPA